MVRTGGRWAAVAVGAALAVAPATVVGAAGVQFGAAGVGDSYFPLAGNGGYDVDHYDLDVDYDTRTGHLDGAAELTATATQGLDRFNLDLHGLVVESVRVDGRRAAFEQVGQELVITPPSRLGTGSRFVVEVRYGGTPGPVTDPDGSIEGWVPTDDGAYVVGEPVGSMTWFPASNHPLDKASYTFRITVPRGLTAIANGRLVSQSDQGRSTTVVWDAPDPMAAYLATATIGRFSVTSTQLPGGLESYVAVDPREARAAAPALARLGDILSYFSSVFGPYPFTSTGAVVDRAPEVGYPLESQTRPVFPEAPDAVGVARAMAHQWFGNSVTMTDWSEIWLSQGFATYAEWLWNEQDGGETAQAAFDAAYAVPADDAEFWNPPPADPTGPEYLFAGSVNTRGAMALHALRTAAGDDAFFAVLRRWAQDNRHGHGTTAQFVALAEEVAGKQAGPLLTRWLYEAGKPALDVRAS
jgi:aminopeptidase N